MSHFADDSNQRPDQKQQHPLGPDNIHHPQRRPYSYPPSGPQPPQQVPRTPSWKMPLAYPRGMHLLNNDSSHAKVPLPNQSRPRRRFPIWARLLVVALALLAVVGGIISTYYQTNLANSLNDITGQTAIRSGGVSIADPLTQRTNILLLGSDTDGKGNDPTQGTPLAQTVIIVTIDPQTNVVGMLSIPRDMQVSDPTQGYANEKLDEVFEHAWVGANANERARTAAGHMMDVIEQNYGISIDHYAWIGLQGFIKVIDTVGGNRCGCHPYHRG